MSLPTEHVLVQSVLNASKQILGRPINPKEPLEIEMIPPIVSFCNSSELSLSAIRFLFVLLVGHSGMLRADELLSIRCNGIDFFEDKMVIFVPKRKSDQHREGYCSNIRGSNKSTCPVSFTEKLLSLLPDEEGSPFPVVKRIVQKKDRKQFHHSHGISYSTLRQEFREHLGPFVVDIKKFGLHSIKSAGASNPVLRRVDSELFHRQHMFKKRWANYLTASARNKVSRFWLHFNRSIV